MVPGTFFVLGLLRPSSGNSFDIAEPTRQLVDAPLAGVGREVPFHPGIGWTGQAGVSGMSVNALLDDFTRQEADYRFQSRTNLEGQRDQTRREMEGAQIQGQGRTESMKPYQAQLVNLSWSQTSSTLTESGALTSLMSTC